MKKRKGKVFVAMSRLRQGFGGQDGGVKISEQKRVFVAMSGGVDSSVAALLLKEKGYDLVGVFMRCFNVDGCAEKDAEDARRVAEKLRIPFYVWDFEKEYKKRVVEYMVDGYRRGLTPNPDVMCNKEIKFGLFLEKALAMGADYVATGHYVRIARNVVNVRNVINANSQLEQAKRSNKRSDKTFKLLTAKDKNKDQSYFLWTLTQDQLKYCLFPIGDYPKSEVRNIARKAGLPTADKKDSQGICFLGKVTLLDFLKEYIPEKRGEVLSVGGERIGAHRGAQFYTIGQRHLGIKYQVSSVRGKHETKPYYLAEKNVKANTLTVAEGNDHPALYKKEIKLNNINFINPETYSLIRANGGMRVFARVRYRQPLAPAMLTYAEQTQTNAEKSPRRSAYSPRRSALLAYEQGQKFVAPGQSAVLYRKTGSAGKNGYRLVGGGIIS